MASRKKQQSQLRWHFLWFVFKCLTIMKPFSVMWWHLHSNFFFQEENTKHITFPWASDVKTRLEMLIFWEHPGCLLSFWVGRKGELLVHLIGVEHNREQMWELMQGSAHAAHDRWKLLPPDGQISYYRPQEQTGYHERCLLGWEVCICSCHNFGQWAGMPPERGLC